MQTESGARNNIVPFSQLFAIFGYTIFVLIVVPIVIEFAVRAGYWAYRVFRPAGVFSEEQRSDVYKNTPWAREFWKEEVSRATTGRDRYEPFRLWGVRTWHGKYVNTDATEMGTLRRTINQSGTCDNPVRIWVFGGSTAFGMGVPDWATIPSQLSAVLNTGAQGCVQVTNLRTPIAV